MASLRESGWDAYQRGEVEEAIRLLDLACRSDPGDILAARQLADAYAHADRLDEAVVALAAAVQAAPASAEARTDLAAMLQRAGRTSEAQEALQQARLLTPEQPAPDTIPSPPTVPSLDPQAAPRPETSDQLPTTSYQLPPAGFQAAGSPHSSALPGHGLLSNYTPSPHAPRGPSVVQETYSPNLPPPNYKDEIDFRRTIRDFWRILIAPDRFFTEQAGRNGMMSPMVMIVIYLIIQLANIVAQGAAQGAFPLIMAIAVAPVNLVFIGAGLVAAYLICALFVHFIGWLFGNREDFSISYRAVVYADAPRILVSTLAAVAIWLLVLPTLRTTMFGIEEEALGLPAGTISSQVTAQGFPAYGGFGSPGTRPPVFTTPPGGSGGPAGAGGSATVTIQPRPSLDRFVKAGQRLWRAYGAIMVASTIVSTVGWLWSNVLLALAIHRMQRISAFKSALVVVIIQTIPIVILLLIGLAVHNFLDSLLQGYLHANATAGRGGT
ncbi:MAG TPA: YIP1 family protein [Chthonomonadaceae bacterium]|nr:YIP1 family protein [Chthonomonadaceae bacterium]